MVKPGRRLRAVAYVGLVTLVALLLRNAADVALVVLTLPAGLAVRYAPGSADLPVELVYPVAAVLNVLVLTAVSLTDPARRAEAGVEQRLSVALTSSRLPVTPMFHSHGTVPAGPVRGRIERSLLLRDVPLAFPELAGVYRDHWQGAGLRVQERTGPPALRALDDQGYELRIEPAPGHFGDTVLQVLSPPRLQPRFTAGLVAGGLVAAAVLLWARVSPTGFAAGFDTPGALRFATLAVLAGVGLALTWPSTRAFGVGFCLPVALAVAAVLTVI
ncbi:hypothetical protein [Winogradskya humida]|uniref:Uncharacterized protein n=1 Tax=Winogradskya humida TaxID=113566 RepID=A0ABQ3ZUT3_9ACTN|nr:hypothetical protein [Actinoplanes humidus]GIE22360.1 hypothetical protein Ahu01nite_054620 [Actinoplanes humidus]